MTGIITVDRGVRNLVDNAHAMRIYDRGHETGARPKLYLASDRDIAAVEYAKRAGIDAQIKQRGYEGAAAFGLMAGGEKHSRRGFIGRALGVGTLGAVASAFAQQDTDEIVYDPNRTENREKGDTKTYYRYVRKVPRGQTGTPLGDIYVIEVWSDGENKWKMAGPHRQLTSQEGQYCINPANPIWIASDKSTDGMDYLLFMNIDTYSWYIGSLGCSKNIVPRTFRWTKLPIEVDVNEGSNNSEVPSWLATTIRSTLPAWNYKGLQFYKEVPKGSPSRLKFLFGDYSTETMFKSSVSCTEPSSINISINKNRDDLQKPWFIGVIVHELGHGLVQWGHAPWPIENVNASNDIMTPIWEPNPATRPSPFNLETVNKMYGGEIPNCAELVYSPTGDAAKYERLYVL